MHNTMCPFSWAALRALTFYHAAVAQPFSALALPQPNQAPTKLRDQTLTPALCGIAKLALAADDRVLDLSSGAEDSLGELLAATPEGSVTGASSSLEFITQAARRHQFSVKAGRLELEHAALEALPFEYGRFSKVLVMNEYANWENPEFCLNEIHRVSKKGAAIVIGLKLRPQTKRWPQFTAGLAGKFAVEEAEEVRGLVRWVGFENVRTDFDHSGWAFVVATR